MLTRADALAPISVSRRLRLNSLREYSQLSLSRFESIDQKHLWGNSRASKCTKSYADTRTTSSEHVGYKETNGQVLHLIVIGVASARSCHRVAVLLLYTIHADALLTFRHWLNNP